MAKPRIPLRTTSITQPQEPTPLPSITERVKNQIRELHDMVKNNPQAQLLSAKVNILFSSFSRKDAYQSDIRAIREFYGVFQKTYKMDIQGFSDCLYNTETAIFGYHHSIDDHDLSKTASWYVLNNVGDLAKATEV